MLAFQVALGILTATIVGASEQVPWPWMIVVSYVLANVLANVIGLAIVDRVGRRLYLIMTPGAVLRLLVLGGAFVFGADGTTTVAAFIVPELLMLFTAGGLQVMGWLTGPGF